MWRLQQDEARRAPDEASADGAAEVAAAARAGKLM
jgi:hypothetical protein